MKSFHSELETLVAVEIAECKKHLAPVRLSDCLAGLCNAVGMAIALAASGDPENVKEGCAVAADAIADRAAKTARMAQLLMAEPEPGSRLQ